jgi:TRAP-type C4-dicarboxylate transport system permease small subunit
MNRILRASENIAALLLLLIALLVTVNVALRYSMSVQVPDWFDVSRLLQAIAIFWGIALTTYRGTHICVDVVWEHMSPRGKRLLDLFATGVTLLFLIPLAWMVWVKVRTTGTQTTMDLRLPHVYFYAFAAVGCIAAALLAGKRLWGLWQGQEVITDAAEAPHGS